MAESTDSGKEVGYGSETKHQRVATFFDGLIYSVIKDDLRFDLDEKTISGFLGKIESSTGLTNRVLLAKTADDLQSPKGRVIVQIIDDGNEDFMAAAVVAAFSPDTPFALVLLNASSPKIEEDVSGNISISTGTALQVLQQVAINQARLISNPKESMTRGEYFALIEQAESNS